MCNVFFYFVLGTWPHAICSIATEVFEPVESRGISCGFFLILDKYVAIIVKNHSLKSQVPTLLSLKKGF